MGLAAWSGHLRTRTGPRDARLREARVCYNHLAGNMATRLFDSMIRRGHLEPAAEGLKLTEAGEAFFVSFGVVVSDLAGKRRPLCRECLDWSERRSHLAGSLGRAVLARIEDLGWARRDQNSRAILFTESGRAAFDQLTRP